MEGQCSRPKKSGRVVVRGDGAVARSVTKRKSQSREQQLSDTAADFGHGLATLVESLVASGHRESEVWKYSVRKAMAYNKLSVQRRKADLYAATVGQRMATQADGKGFEKYMKTFDEE